MIEITEFIKKYMAALDQAFPDRVCSIKYTEHIPAYSPAFAPVFFALRLLRQISTAIGTSEIKIIRTISNFRLRCTTSNPPNSYPAYEKSATHTTPPMMLYDAKWR